MIRIAVAGVLLVAASLAQLGAEVEPGVKTPVSVCLNVAEAYPRTLSGAALALTPVEVTEDWPLLSPENELDAFCDLATNED